MHQLFLGSESPRRRELLQQAGIPFLVFPVKVSEIPDKNLNVDQRILAIARQKATAAYALLEKSQTSPFVLLTADTEVVLDDELLGKPTSTAHAFEILRNLSGRAHYVKTGICLIEGKTRREVSHVETSEVRFRILSDKEISEYVKTGEPMDKAGAYGIQGFGRGLIDSFQGDFNNIVGLPITVLLQTFKNQGWDFTK